MQHNYIELPPTCKMNYVIKELCLNITTNLSGVALTDLTKQRRMWRHKWRHIQAWQTMTVLPQMYITFSWSFQALRNVLPLKLIHSNCNQCQQCDVTNTVTYSVFILKWSRIIHLKLFSWEFWKTVCSSMYVWGYSKNKKTKTKKTPQNVPFFIFIPNCKTVDGV